MSETTPVDPALLGKVLEESNSELSPDLKRVDFKQTWDDDCEQVIISHPTWKGPGPKPDRYEEHIHHDRVAIVKKSANSITLEPMMFHRKYGGRPEPFNEQMSYVRTTETDTHGRTIFRQGVPV